AKGNIRKLRLVSSVSSRAEHDGCIGLLAIEHRFPGDDRLDSPDLTAFVLHGEKDAIESGQGILPFGGIPDRASLDQEEDLRIARTDESEQCPVDEVALCSLVAIEWLEQQAHLIVDTVPGGLAGSELLRQLTNLPQPLGRSLGWRRSIRDRLEPHARLA